MRLIKLMVLFILGITLTNCSKDDDSLNSEERTPYPLNSEERTQVELTADFLSSGLWRVESIRSPNEKLSQDHISNFLKQFENVRFRFDGNTLYTLGQEETDTLGIETISIKENTISVEESNLIDYNGLGYSYLINVRALRNNRGNGGKFLEFKTKISDKLFDKVLEEILEKRGINPTQEEKEKVKAIMEDLVYVWKMV